MRKIILVVSENPKRVLDSGLGCLSNDEGYLIIPRTPVNCFYEKVIAALVIVDMELPKGRDGRVLIRRIRTNMYRQKTPILIFGNFSNLGYNDWTEYQECGIRGIIDSNENKAFIYKLIKELLSSNILESDNLTSFDSENNEGRLDAKTRDKSRYSFSREPKEFYPEEEIVYSEVNYTHAGNTYSCGGQL